MTEEPEEQVEDQEDEQEESTVICLIVFGKNPNDEFSDELLEELSNARSW